MGNSNEQSIKDALKELVETYRLKSKLHQNRIHELWEKQMGNTISRYTSDIKLRGQKLYITIDSAPLRQELSYGREKILHTLNEGLGENYIKELIIK